MRHCYQILKSIFSLVVLCFLVLSNTSEAKLKPTDPKLNIEQIHPDLLKGMNLFFGFNENQDFTKAWELLIPYSTENNSFAHMLLADMFLSGLGVQKDLKKGVMLLYLSSYRLNKLATNKLRYLSSLVRSENRKFYLENERFFSVNDSIIDDNRTAYYKQNRHIPHIFEDEKIWVIEYLAKASSKGNAIAQNMLGDMYFNKIMGVGLYKEIAYEFYDLAASKGNPNAILNKAHMLVCGYGVKKDIPLAIKLTNDIAEKYKISYLFLEIADLYIYGEEGVKQSYEEALVWLKKAADMGSEMGQYTYDLVKNADNPRNAGELDRSKMWRDLANSCLFMKYPLFLK